MNRIQKYLHQYISILKIYKGRITILFKKNLILRSISSRLYTHLRSLAHIYFNGAPTSVEKRKFLCGIASKNNIQTLVETGTYLGQSTRYFSKHFNDVISVEISYSLYSFCKKKFRNIANIQVLFGDSIEILPRIVSELKEQTVFYFDAHASGGVTEQGVEPSPIKKELKIIENFTFLQESIIAIDDARGFNGDNSYPTITDVRKWALSNHLNTPYIKLDMIIIDPISNLDK